MDVEKLKKIGGKPWENYGYHRIYFNNIATLLNVKKKGNRITLNGELLEGEEAERVENAILIGKFWYDVDTKEFSCRNFKAEHNLKEIMISSIKKEVSVVDDILEDELFEI